MAALSFRTKAQTLDSVKSRLNSAVVLPLYYFSVDDWNNHRPEVLKKLSSQAWAASKLIVRSSSLAEDTGFSSLAGHFISSKAVLGKEAIINAVEKTIASFKDKNGKSEVLIQPLLEEVSMSGVAFGIDPNSGGAYYIVNYDDQSGQTDTVTSGVGDHLQCCIHYHGSPVILPPPLNVVIHLIEELVQLFGTYAIDIEFAIDNNNQLYLFQVRPLILRAGAHLSSEKQTRALQRIVDRLEQLMQPHPYLHGKTTIFGVMPDWNPAEIIGMRPKQLALTLYKELITDSTWAYQRNNYGYMNLRGFPLMLDFSGIPYIDVRVSLNSFIPKDLPKELVEKLADYYLNQLIAHPELHDKIEFGVVLSCYSADLKDRIKKLDAYGFSKEEQKLLFQSLLRLTNNVLQKQNGLWIQDIKRIKVLEKRQSILASSDLDTLSKLYWLIEDCKRYGTLPFAGLARAGFIAVQILNSLVDLEIISELEKQAFFQSLDTVSSQMARDIHTLAPESFIKKYGHLRPGTYDILSERYDEAPEQYFDFGKIKLEKEDANIPEFTLSIPQMRKLQHCLDQDGVILNALDLLEFIKRAIESREYAKFVFTRNTSDALSLIGSLGASYGFDLEDCAFLDVRTLLNMYSSASDIKIHLQKSIEIGKKKFTYTCSMNPPALIVKPDDLWSHTVLGLVPNYITQKRVDGKIIHITAPREQMRGKILMIENADPGFDWIFLQGIKGFVTKYGGINSHMAIRAGELGIPAVIGAGEMLYELWNRYDYIRLDCSNRRVLELS